MAPCFDLTYSEDPGGGQQMAVCGEGRHTGRSHVRQLAQQGGWDVRWAGQRLDAMLDVVKQWGDLIGDFDIRCAAVQATHQTVQREQSLLAR